MAFEVIKTIRGRRYRYLQESYRQGGKVKTRMKYIGPVDAPLRKRKGGGVGLPIGLPLVMAAHFLRKAVDSKYGRRHGTHPNGSKRGRPFDPRSEETQRANFYRDTEDAINRLGVQGFIRSKQAKGKETVHAPSAKEMELQDLIREFNARHPASPSAPEPSPDEQGQPSEQSPGDVPETEPQT